MALSVICICSYSGGDSGRRGIIVSGVCGGGDRGGGVLCSCMCVVLEGGRSSEFYRIVRLLFLCSARAIFREVTSGGKVTPSEKRECFLERNQRTEERERKSSVWSLVWLTYR